MTSFGPPAFNADHLRTLSDLHVTEAQTIRLAALLPTLRAMVAPAPRMQDVRDELKNLETSLRTSAQTLRRLEFPSILWRLGLNPSDCL